MDARVLVPMLNASRTRFVRLARRRLPTEADAEDVVQQAMLRATERAGSLEDPARVVPWFGRIVERGIADFYRSRRPDIPSDDAANALVAEATEAPHNPCACS